MFELVLMASIDELRKAIELLESSAGAIESGARGQSELEKP